jgi:DNA-binding MarR family transcriptional regulator
MSAVLSSVVARISPDRVEAPRTVDFSQQADVLAGESVCELLVLLKEICSSMAHDVDRRLACHDLTLAKAMPLLVLLESPDQIVTSIARCGHCDAGAMTRILYELEGKGMISRTRSDADRRVVHLKLTRRGRRVAKELPEVIQAATDRQLAGFESADRQALMVALRRMSADRGGQPA